MTTRVTEKSAIDAALSQHWQEAFTLNKSILKDDPKNIDALNRFGFAAIKLGKSAEAKSSYAKVLKLDPYNHIAIANVKKINTHKSGTHHNDIVLTPSLFLEESGKTKIIDCVHPAPNTMLSDLACGQILTMKVKKHGIDLRDCHGVYVGALPDDISFKIGKFIAGGNEYSVCVKHVGKDKLTIFVREMKRGKKFQKQPSFTSTINYMPSVREAIHTEGDKDATAPPEEESGS
jgi:hypothetical protein